MDQSPEKQPSPAQDSVRLGWLAFYLLLLAPAALGLILLSTKTNSEPLGVTLLSVGVLMNLYCGYWSAFRWLKNSPVAATFLGLVMAFLYFCLNTVVFFFGCLAIAPAL